MSFNAIQGTAIDARHVQPTDYPLLSERISDIVERSLSNDYEECVASLLTVMRKQFPALTQEHNPVLAGLATWTPSQLRFIVQEYSGFSNAAIHMFLEARIRNHWPALTTEIIHNMDEEMGALTRGIPHLELMRYGYRVELGIETDGLTYTTTTRDFIDHMHALFRERDNTALAGVLLAFEGTAVDEFRIVERLLQTYKQMLGGSITPESLTGLYVAGHVVPGTPDPEHDPEMDHYRGLVDAVGAHVKGLDLRPLVIGFLSVCLELNRWWEQLTFEAFQKGIRDRLSEHRTETPDLYASLIRG